MINHPISRAIPNNEPLLRMVYGIGFTMVYHINQLFWALYIIASSMRSNSETSPAPGRLVAWLHDPLEGRHRRPIQIFRDVPRRNDMIRGIDIGDVAEHVVFLCKGGSVSFGCQFFFFLDTIFSSHDIEVQGCLWTDQKCNLPSRYFWHDLVVSV